tara:strand:+ start:4084 stop:4404 length:321 start_codon:yes stop_codon:yes gene_type:complete
MDKLKKLIQSLLTAGKPKTHTDTIRVRMTPKVNPKDGKPFTYADITSQVELGTILTFGDTSYRFEASPSGTMYTGKNGIPTPQKYDQFSLVHTISVDDWDSAFDVS